MITPDNFKKYFPTTSLTDEQIAHWSEVATDMIADYIGYDPKLQTRIEKEFTLFDPENLQLRYKPIESVTTLYIDNVAITETLIVDKNYVQVLDYASVYNPYCENYINCEYMAGVDPLKLPKSLEYAIASWINSTTQYSSSGQLESYKIETISYKFKTQDDFNSEVKAILDKVFF